MIEITSYLRDEDGEYTRVADAMKPPSGPRYIEGALELKINGVMVIDLAMWDYIDILWCYISDMVASLLAKGEAGTNFPDQPIRLGLERVRGHEVLVTLTMDDERRAVSVDQDELIDALSRYGLEFFRAMLRLVPVNFPAYAESIERLKRVRA
jgi:hypothetical protein